MRAAGLSCRKARKLANRWAQSGLPPRLQKFVADVDDYGGTLRVVLQRPGEYDDDDDATSHQHGDDAHRQRLVIFLYQPPTP